MAKRKSKAARPAREKAKRAKSSRSPALQNLTPERLSAKRAEAVALVASDELPDSEIAKKIGVTRQTLWNWRREPEFIEEVIKVAKRMAAAVQRYAISHKVNRVRVLDDMWHRMRDLVDARAKDKEMQAVAGGSTGVLCRDIKWIGTGKNARMVEVFNFDAAVAREMRDTARQAAQELGQWVEKVAPTSPDGTEPFDGCGKPFSPEDQLRLVESVLTRLGIKDDREAERGQIGVAGSPAPVPGAPVLPGGVPT